MCVNILNSLQLLLCYLCRVVNRITITENIQDAAMNQCGKVVKYKIIEPGPAGNLT